MVADIERNAKVSLSFQGDKAFLVAVEGTADLIRDRQTFKEHWTPDLDHWFENGVETEGVVMIKVRAERAHYWDGEDEGEVSLGTKQ